MVCIKEINHLGRILWKRTFKIISYIEFSANNITIYNINMKINISYTVNKELQGTHTG